MPAVSSEVWQQWLAHEHSRRIASDTWRAVAVMEHQGRWAVDHVGRRLLNFTSNDYLGMAEEPEVTAAAARATARGAGSTAARLMAGTDGPYCALEEKLARYQRTSGALIFGSGYLANVGTISALVGKDDAVFSDRLNHASIVDGCLLSRASVYRYRHGDVEHLESMLRDADRRGQKRKLIVTESIFSMDGDTAPLREIGELRDRFGAALMVDEAHALGVFGGEGRGYSDALGITEKVDIHVGTFGKSLGSYGAYVAADDQWIDCLLNTARTFIFSTALPPAVIGAVDVSLDLVRAADGHRSHILELASNFRSQLSALGANVLNSTTQIVPVVIGSSAWTLEAARILEEAGVWARAIRSPTVPRSTSRLRFSLTSLLTCEDVNLAVSAVASCLGDNDDGAAT